MVQGISPVLLQVDLAFFAFFLPAGKCSRLQLGPLCLCAEILNPNGRIRVGNAALRTRSQA